MSATLATVDLAAPENDALSGKQAYAMAHMSGSGSRVWFSGSPQQRLLKEEWLAAARDNWIAEIAGRTSDASWQPPHDADRLIGLAKLDFDQIQQSSPNSLAARFAAAFPDLASDENARHERTALASLAYGCSAANIPGVASFSDFFKLGPLPQKADKACAIAESKRLKTQRAWAPGTQDHFARIDQAPADAESAWAPLEKAAQSLVERRGLGWLAIDDALSPGQAAQALADLDTSMELLERETGLGPGSSGLSGWSVRIGVAMDDASGKCYGHSRCIELGAASGDGAFAHEWLHALDNELGRAACSDVRGLLSESPSAQGPLREAMDRLIQAILAPTPESETGQPAARSGLKAFAAEFLYQSGTRNSLSGAARQEFDAQWMDRAASMFEASTPSAEKIAFDQLKAVYRSVRPALEDGDFDSIEACFRTIKNPDPKFLQKLAEASSKSSFFQDALSVEVRDDKIYMAKPCELLARAFESSFALDAAREQLPTARQSKTVSMVSSTDDASLSVPQGSERDRSRAAFAAFFSDIRSELRALPNPPAWARSIPLEEAAAPRLIDKLLARRGDGGLSSTRPDIRRPNTLA